MILGRGNAPQEKGEYKEIPRNIILEKYKDDEIEKLVAEYKAIEEQKAATAEKTKEQVDTGTKCSCSGNCGTGGSGKVHSHSPMIKTPAERHHKPAGEKATEEKGA
ncbi:MAG: hypothetical protein U0519_00270 [Candidatus Gracilibacteria bacterium]